MAIIGNNHNDGNWQRYPQYLCSQSHSKSLLLWMLLWLFHFVIFCLLSILLHITHLSFVNEIITRHCTIFMFPNLRDRHNVHILNPLYRNIQHFSTLIATLSGISGIIRQQITSSPIMKYHKRTVYISTYYATISR